MTSHQNSLTLTHHKPRPATMKNAPLSISRVRHPVVHEKENRAFLSKRRTKKKATRSLLLSSECESLLDDYEASTQSDVGSYYDCFSKVSGRGMEAEVKPTENGNDSSTISFFDYPAEQEREDQPRSSTCCSSFYDCASKMAGGAEEDEVADSCDRIGVPSAEGEETAEHRDQASNSSSSGSQPTRDHDDDNSSSLDEWFTAIEGNHNNNKINTMSEHETDSSSSSSLGSPTRGQRKLGLVRRLSSSLLHNLLPFNDIDEEEEEPAWYVRKADGDATAEEVDEISSHTMQTVFYDYVGPSEDSSEPEQE